MAWAGGQAEYTTPLLTGKMCELPQESLTLPGFSSTRHPAPSVYVKYVPQFMRKLLKNWEICKPSLETLLYDLYKMNSDTDIVYLCHAFKWWFDALFCLSVHGYCKCNRRDIIHFLEFSISHSCWDAQSVLRPRRLKWSGRVLRYHVDVLNHTGDWRNNVVWPLWHCGLTLGRSIWCRFRDEQNNPNGFIITLSAHQLNILDSYLPLG
jgi:hypothetical protein